MAETLADQLQENDDAIGRAVEQLDLDEVDRLLIERERIQIEQLDRIRQALLGLRRTVGMTK